MTPILLRYADADAPFGQHVLSSLTAAGLSVSAAPAPATRQRAAAQAQASQAVVVLWSRQALRSPALLLQVAMAKAQGKLVAARIEPGLAPVGGAAMIDLTDWRRGLAALTDHLQPKPTTQSAAPLAANQWSPAKIQTVKSSSSRGWLLLAAAAVGFVIAMLALTGQLGY